MEPDHLTPADVFGFIEDDLDPVWLELVWEHLDRCEECVHYLALVLGADRASQKKAGLPDKWAGARLSSLPRLA